MTNLTWAVRMQGVNKRFGMVQANDNVDLQVADASIHAVVGENGAGKSTLMSILYGMYQADAGRIEVHGQGLDVKSAHDAIAAGIGMVHQHFMLVDTLSVLDNVMLGAEGHLLLNTAAAHARAGLTDLMQRTGLKVNLDALVGDLSVGDRQRLEILKTLFRGARVLILDEPSAVLTPQETVQLFEVLRRLREQQTTIIIITHKLKEVIALCDDVTVMRSGQVVLRTAVADTCMEDLALAMVGRKVNMGERIDRSDSSSVGDVVLRAEALSWVDSWGVQRLCDVDIELHAGEILGVAGVSGNGQSELLDALSGLLQPDSGCLQVLGDVYQHDHWLTPRRARQIGLMHVPEDRHARALVMPFVAWESAVLGYEDDARFSNGPWMRHNHMKAATQEMMDIFDVRPRNPMLRCNALSGGNQQKLVLAREMSRSPKVLLVGQPTRGVDIGAIEFIHGRIRAMRDAGCAVLLVSSELDEILALSDRILVMSQGAITGRLGAQECDETQLGLRMTAEVTS